MDLMSIQIGALNVYVLKEEEQQRPRVVEVVTSIASNDNVLKVQVEKTTPWYMLFLMRFLQLNQKMILFVTVATELIAVYVLHLSTSWQK